MGAISALSDAGGALQRNPVLFAWALVIGVLGTFVQFGSNVIPFVGLLIGFGYFFFEPLLAGGFLGMADEAVTGRTSAGSFWRHGKENYTDLLLARLVVGIALAVAGFVFAIAYVFVVGVSGAMQSAATGAASTSPTGTSGSMLAAFGLYAAMVLVFAVVGLVIQFYPAAIVIGDADPIESFTYSYLVLKEHPLSVVGYSVLTVLLGPGLLLAAGVGFFFAMGEGGGLVPTGLGSQLGAGGSLLALVLAFAVGLVVVRTLQIGFLRTYYVSFVRSVAS